MEQAVWFYVGIIAALIGLGMLVSVVLLGTDVTKQQLAKNAANSLALQCNNVCNSDMGTALGIKTDLSSGTVISGGEKSVCVEYVPAGKKECRKCNCKVLGDDGNFYRLDLSTEEAMEMFETHVYNCIFERDIDGVILRCKG